MDNTRGFHQAPTNGLPMSARGDRHGWGLVAGICLGFASGVGSFAAPAIADTQAAFSVPAGSDPLSAEQISVDGQNINCGALPPEAFLKHDSALLKRALCELLVFPPLSVSSFESFPEFVRPGSYASDREPSADAMTLPSLWWSRDSLPRQFGSYRLVESWSAYEIDASATRVVDVYINSQIWRILQYSERYGALNRLAAEASSYQYHLRLFSYNLRDPQLLGIYLCDFSGEAISTNLEAGTSPSGCMAVLDPETLSRLRNALLNPSDIEQPSAESVVGTRTQTPEPETLN